MAGLRDQLLKSGLVNEKQVKKAQKEKHKEQRQPGKSAVSDEKLRLQQAQAEKAERDRLLNQQRKEEAERKALIAQVRQLIETQRIARFEGEVPFNFTDSGTVKKLYLDQKIRDQLVKGLLAIVKFNDRYDMVPRETAEKIGQRMAEAVILLNEAVKSEAPAADDPYAAYQVPDDLIW